MTTYYAPNHVFLCLVSDRYIALDLKSDRYISFDGARADVLGALITSDDTDDAGVARPPQSAIEETVRELTRNGLLTCDPSQGKALAVTTFDRPRDHLVQEPVKEPLRIGPGHVWAFLAACMTASRRLRRSSIEETVNTIKERRCKRKSINEDINFLKARDLVSIFRTLRPIFPRDYLCTFDSLALMEFLARYDTFPTWVFGVETDPFRAHCWVQEKGTVFNDHVDMVAELTPVMTV